MKATDKELEILKALWHQGSASVKDVHEALGGEKNNGYTTILKLLQIMTEKGLVLREKSGKLHLYRAAESQDKMRKTLLDKLADTAFQGSMKQLVMSALGNTKSSKQELEEIKRYLESLEKDNG